MKTFILTALVSLVATSAFASTPVEAVNKIDLEREGDLSAKVVDFYNKNLKVECETNELAKVDIVKLSSSSMNEEKTPNTPYSYSATYLVVQKCLYGSTFVGAYSDAKKASIVTGSFKASYNFKGGPKEMKDLKIELVKDVPEVL